jgi:hypothetical protein
MRDRGKEMRIIAIYFSSMWMYSHGRARLGAQKRGAERLSAGGCAWAGEACKTLQSLQDATT